MCNAAKGSWLTSGRRLAKRSHYRIVSCCCCYQVRTVALPNRCSLRLGQGTGLAGGAAAKVSLTWAHDLPISHWMRSCVVHTMSLSTSTCMEERKTATCRLNQAPGTQNGCNDVLLHVLRCHELHRNLMSSSRPTSEPGPHLYFVRLDRVAAADQAAKPHLRALHVVAQPPAQPAAFEGTRLCRPAGKWLAKSSTPGSWLNQESIIKSQ